MPAGYSFRPRAWALALAVAACAAGIALGNWQAHRAEEKRALGAGLQRIEARGEFLPEHTVLLDNKLRQRRPGYEVVTPLRTSHSHILVNRGWIAAGPSREVLPEVRTPAGEVRIEGVVLQRLPQALHLQEDPKSRVRQNLDVAAFAAETGMRLQPFVIEQHRGPDDGLLRDWPRRDAGVEKHDMYALQWYSLAVLAVVLGIALSFRRVAKN